MKKDSDNQLLFDFDTPLYETSTPVQSNEPDLPPASEAVPVDTGLIPDTASDGGSVAGSNEVSPAVAAPETAVVGSEKKPRSNGDPELPLYQAVLAHLVKNGATAAALHVPCRLRKFKAPVAAYYSQYKGRLNKLSAAVVVDVYSKREQCLPECAGSDAVARELVELKQQRSTMEAQIRIDEPHLRAEDELFDEFRSFNYSASSNKKYHKLCRRIRSLEQSLYKGTRMELLARAAVADYLIIAVPENLIAPDEMPDNWGVWYILPDGSVREVKAPEKQECSDESRLHLMQNIGHAALNSVLFANGIKMRSDGTARFTRLPRARRK